MDTSKEITSPIRIEWIDVVRTIACVMVVLLHSLPSGNIVGVDDSFRTFIIVITRPCVPLFFMITGVLLLKEQRLGFDALSFYKKRIPRVAYPLVIWGVVYALLSYFAGMTTYREALYELVLSPLRYPQQIGGILWYLFTLIGVYFFLPFLAPQTWLKASNSLIYITLWVVTSLLPVVWFLDDKILASPPAISTDVLVYFSGVLGYLVLGHLIYSADISLSKMQKMALGVMLAIICVGYYWIICIRANYYMIQFTSFPTIIMTAALFIILKNINLKWGGGGKMAVKDEFWDLSVSYGYIYYSYKTLIFYNNITMDADNCCDIDSNGRIYSRLGSIQTTIS